MRKYSKPQIVAKNLPTGSYAAGCRQGMGVLELFLVFVSLVREQDKSLSGLYCINAN